MINWFKGWKGIAVGAAFIALSLVYNSIFKTQIVNSVLLQIPGYFLLGIGCVLVMYAALSSSDSKKEENSETAEAVAAAEETEVAPSEEENQ